MNHVDIKSRKAELDGNYCLVLTSNSVEKAAVKRVAGKSLQVWVDQITSGAYLSLIGGALALHISGESGISKERSIGRIANAFLRNASMPKPRLVLLVGFCWRNPALVMDKALIISAQVCCANLRSATDGALAARMTWPQSALALDEHQEHRILVDLAAAGIADACIGPIASAETLFQDSALRDELIAAHPALLGGEMEAFSFIAPGIPWLVVKAASDAGGDDFDRAQQEASAKLAASAIAPLLTSFAQDETIASEDRQRSESLRDLIDGGVLISSET